MKNNQNEVWKDIKGYEGYYRISNLGRVESLNYRGSGKKLLLKGTVSKDKEVKVNLCDPANGLKKNYAIHRLVAIAFVPNPYNLPIVKHKDGNGFNNQASNLEWSMRCVPKKSVLTAHKIQGSATAHRNNNLSTRASSAPFPRQFALSDRTAALLSLVVELDMVVERVEDSAKGLADSQKVGYFNECIFDAKEVLQKIAVDSIWENLAWIDNINKDIVNI